LLRKTTLAARRNGPLPVLPEVDRTLNKIGATLFEGVLEHLGIDQGEVGRRKHVEDLAGDERDHLLMVA
jgi:hypothetical protein